MICVSRSLQEIYCVDSFFNGDEAAAPLVVLQQGRWQVATLHSSKDLAVEEKGKSNLAMLFLSHHQAGCLK